MMESLILFIEELNVGQYMGKWIRNLQEHQFCAVVRSWSGLENKIWINNNKMLLCMGILTCGGGT